jgi:hypothetical protein
MLELGSSSKSKLYEEVDICLSIADGGHTTVRYTASRMIPFRHLTDVSIKIAYSRLQLLVSSDSPKQ